MSSSVPQPSPTGRRLEPVVFGTTIEALVSRALHGRMTPRIEAVLRDLKIDLSRIAAAYEYPTWAKLLDVLTSEVYPKLSKDDALFELGRDYIRGLEHTLVGKAIHAASRLAGAKRMLERMTRNARGANNYLETRLEYAPDGSSRMHVSIVPPLQEAMKTLPPYQAHYFRGILHGALEAANAKGISVTIEEHDVENKRTVYAIRYAL